MEKNFRFFFQFQILKNFFLQDVISFPDENRSHFLLTRKTGTKFQVSEFFNFFQKSFSQDFLQQKNERNFFLTKSFFFTEISTFSNLNSPLFMKSPHLNFSGIKKFQVCFVLKIFNSQFSKIF